MNTIVIENEAIVVLDGLRAVEKTDNSGWLEVNEKIQYFLLFIAKDGGRYSKSFKSRESRDDYFVQIQEWMNNTP